MEKLKVVYEHPDKSVVHVTDIGDKYEVALEHCEGDDTALMNKMERIMKFSGHGHDWTSFEGDKDAVEKFIAEERMEVLDWDRVPNNEVSCLIRGV